MVKKLFHLLFAFTLFVTSIPADPGTAFNYQGLLNEGGAPASGNYDITFSLWDSESGGTQIGVTIQQTDYVITDGIIEAGLDFGPAAFNGDPRWLEIAVGPSTTRGSTLVTLAPRRPVLPAPYAQYAVLAESAVNDAIDDADATNELQTLSFRAPDLAITNGNSVDLSTLVPTIPDGHSLDADDGSPGDALYIDSQGFAGIGTQAPTAGLQINSAPTEVPLSITELGTAIDEAGFPFLNAAGEVWVEGNIAYVVSQSDDSLTMIDVSNPASPVQLGAAVHGTGFTALDRPLDVLVADEIAYIATESSDSLTMIDVSNPATPVEIGAAVFGAGFTALNAANSVFLVGTTAYVTSRSPDALSIIDVSDPANPVELGTAVEGDEVSVFGGPFDVAVSNNIAYVAGNGGQRLVIIDVSDPANPVELSAAINGQGFSNMASPIQVTISGMIAYVVAQGGDSLSLIDVSDPSNPSQLGVFGATSGATAMDQPRGIFLDGNVAYIASQVSDSLTLIDVSDPANPVEIGVAIHGDGFSALNGASGVFVSGSAAYVASSTSGSLSIIDVTIPRQPLSLRVSQDASFGRNVSIAGELTAGKLLGDGADLSGIDTDPANELQTLSGTGSAVILSNGGGTQRVSALAALDGDPDNVVAVQADGDILVDGTTVFVDISENRIGIGESTPLAGAVDIQNSSLDAADGAASDQFHLMLRNESNTDGAEVGLGFKVTTTTTGGPGAAITHERTAGSGVGDLHFKTASTGGSVVTRMTIDSSGRVFMPDLTSSITGVAVEYVPSSGELIVVTSSEKFKENIEPALLEAEKMLQLQPVSYNYKESDRKALGYIAEQLDALGLDQLVVYDEQGEPYSIAYKLIPLFHNELIKKHEHRLAEKDAEIEYLRQRIAEQNSRLDRLESLLEGSAGE